jgi:hypothetical protein
VANGARLSEANLYCRDRSAADTSLPAAAAAKIIQIICDADFGSTEIGRFRRH